MAVILYLCSPYEGMRRKIANIVKNTTLKEVFNNTYKKEKSKEFKQLLREHKVGYGQKMEVNNGFSATYDNIKFQYADVLFYHNTKYSDEYSTEIERTFHGQIYVFDTKYIINGDLYLGKKIKKLFRVKSNMDPFINTKKNIDIEPSNIVLDKNISIKSNAHPSIIEDSTFLEIIKDFILNKKCIFIYHENKLFVLKNSKKDSFKITINKKEDELKAKEHIINDINIIKSDLDSIIKYKDKLNIREDRHMKTINEEEIISENN